MKNPTTLERIVDYNPAYYWSQQRSYSKKKRKELIKALQENNIERFYSASNTRSIVESLESRISQHYKKKAYKALIKEQK